MKTEPPYQYVRGNPVNRVDPTGMIPSSTDMCLTCNFDAEGYAEGYSYAYSILFHTRVPKGREVVYDFATMERASFVYKDTPLFVVLENQEDESGYRPPGYSTSLIEGVGIAYGVNLYAFESMDGIETDYSGRFEGFSLGLNTPGVEFGGGYMAIWSHGGDDYFTGELDLYGHGVYFW